MAIRRRPCRQDCKRFSAGRTSTAANPDPIVLLVVRLFAPPPMTDDGVVATERASPRQQPQRDCRYPGSVLSFVSGSAIKRIRAGVKAPSPTVLCQSSDLLAGPSPSGKVSFE